MLDLTNQRFGRLTAVEKTVGRKRLAWLCKCDCGGTTTLETNAITSGKTLSCGCLRKETSAAIGRKTKPKLHLTNIGFNKILLKYKSGAKLRNLTWDLTDDEFRFLTSLDCHYCGVEPKRAAIYQRAKSHTPDEAPFLYSGIDRLDPTVGYELGNVVPACTDCNLAKQSLTRDEFLDLAKRIYLNTLQGT